MSQDVLIRPLQEQDIDDEYLSWFVNEDGHLDYFTGSGRVFTKKMVVDDFREGLAGKNWFYYMIESKEGVRIGNVKIGPIDKKNKTSDLVCLIGNRGFLGRGIASKAIAMANEIAFEEYDIRRLQGGMFEGNIGSIKAYTRAGWFIEARMRGYYWIDGVSQDRVCVACLNPRYFNDVDDNQGN
ncbi:GNAT family N-acetyltransferase [Alloalcanivorax marinus]|uniref:GNAT family N-acetyltransferase n=1 Tax=Alloalcanivorax marinus TaxID=1177169 RepID=UPI001933877B|nr:GNAT family N-acetyltransferase [Alloalcanivorax marinus]MBL7249438.1 GNAT family N-acetyltransferase [Alloalcanivorax marinus]